MRKDHSSDADGAIEAAARAWAAEEEGSVTEHPDPGALVDYQEGRLDPGGAQRVQRHLVVCPACREELLELGAFDREVPEDSTLRPSEEATERSWQRFQAARAALRPAPGGASNTPSAVQSHPRTWPRARWLLAASVFLALGAGALLGAILSNRIAPGRMESAGSPFVFDLDPTGTSVVRDATGLPEIAVPPGMDPLVPRLNLGDLTEHEGYLVEVYDDRDRLILRREGLVRHRSGSVTFLVPRAQWPAGEYRLLLIALDSGRRQELASYGVRLRYQK